MRAGPKINPIFNLRKTEKTVLSSAHDSYEVLNFLRKTISKDTEYQRHGCVLKLYGKTQEYYPEVMVVSHDQVEQTVRTVAS